MGISLCVKSYNDVILIPSRSFRVKNHHHIDRLNLITHTLISYINQLNIQLKIIQAMDKSPAAATAFKPAVSYFGYTIHFLTKAIFVKLKDDVTVKTCKFGLLIKDLSDDDVSAIDDALNMVQYHSLSFDPENFFVKKFNKWNSFNSKGQRNQALPDELRARIQLKITGYKTSSTGKSTPMIEISELREL